MDDARVAVVIPCYNAQNTLARTLDSVISQEFTDWCIMAVNDGSTDETETILSNYRERYPGKISFISQKNKGQTAAKNLAIANTQSEYIALLDSDDLWAPDKLGKQVALLDAQPQVGMCYTAAHLINQKDKSFDEIMVSPPHRGRCHREFIIRNNVIASSVIIRRSALEATGFYDISFTACENWDLWIRLAENHVIEFIAEPLTFYRVHPDNMSKNFENIFQCRLQVINKHLPHDSDNPSIPTLRKTALFRAHVAFAKAYLEVLNLQAARRELLQAIKIKPLVVENYLLFLKSLLGRRIFLMVRNIKNKDRLHADITG